MKKRTASRAPRFDRQWAELINLLPDKNDRKLLTDAIIKYQLDTTEPHLPAHLAVAFGFIRPTIDRRAHARIRRRERMEKQHRAEDITDKPAVEAVPQTAIAPKPTRAGAKAEKRTAKKAANQMKPKPFKKIVLTAKRHRDNPLRHAVRHQLRRREWQGGASGREDNPVGKELRKKTGDNS